MSANLAAAALPLPDPIDLGVLPSELDGGLASRAAIGLAILATDQTLEHEFRALVRIPGVAFYEARVFNDHNITPDTLRAIGPRIAPCVDLILPSLPLDVVGFGCTSATMTLGEEAVFAEIRKARPGVACTTPVTGALAAFKALGVKGIGLLTPYSPKINERPRRLFHRPWPRHSGRRHLRPAGRPRSRPHLARLDRGSRRAHGRDARGARRSSSPAPAYASPKRWQASNSASASPSPPATTPWPGIVCGSRGSMMSCPQAAGYSGCRRADASLIISRIEIHGLTNRKSLLNRSPLCPAMGGMTE